jgi:hypothetical protein
MYFWMVGAHSLIRLLFLLPLINSIHAQDDCRESSCGPHNPFSIRFPFQLVRESQDRCVYPEFCLYCTENKRTMMVLSTTSGPVKFLVNGIDYIFNRIFISDLDNCIAKKFLTLNNSSFLPYRFDHESETTKLSFFNCSSVRKHHLRNVDQMSNESQDMITCPIYFSYSYHSVLVLDLTSCTKMFDLSTTIQGPEYNSLALSWPKPNCTECEAKGMKCKWKNNSTKGDTQCFYCNNKRKIIQIPKSLIYASTG